MYCKSCGAAVAGKYCSCCGARVGEDVRKPSMPLDDFGKAIDLMCRYRISADDLAKHMGITKQDVLLIIGHGAFSEAAVRLCVAIADIAIPLIRKRNEESDARLRQIRAEMAAKENEKGGKTKWQESMA